MWRFIGWMDGWMLSSRFWKLAKFQTELSAVQQQLIIRTPLRTTPTLFPYTRFCALYRRGWFRLKECWKFLQRPWEWLDQSASVSLRMPAHFSGSAPRLEPVCRSWFILMHFRCQRARQLWWGRAWSIPGLHFCSEISHGSWQMVAGREGGRHDLMGSSLWRTKLYSANEQWRPLGFSGASECSLLHEGLAERNARKTADVWRQMKITVFGASCPTLQLIPLSTVLKLQFLHKVCLTFWSLPFNHQLPAHAICMENGCWQLLTVQLATAWLLCPFPHLRSDWPSQGKGNQRYALTIIVLPRLQEIFFVLVL